MRFIQKYKLEVYPTTKLEIYLTSIAESSSFKALNLHHQIFGQVLSKTEKETLIKFLKTLRIVLLNSKVDRSTATRIYLNENYSSLAISLYVTLP